VVPFLRLRVLESPAETLCQDVVERLRSVPPDGLHGALILVEALEPSLSTLQRSKLVGTLLERLDIPDATARGTLVRELVREADMTGFAIEAESFRRGIPLNSRGLAELSLELMGKVLDAIIGRISDPDPSVRLTTLKLLDNSRQLFVRPANEAPTAPGPWIDAGRRTRWIDALVGRLDDAPPIRQAAFDLLVRRFVYSRSIPDLSEHSWKATMSLLERRLRSEDGPVRRETILALARLAGGAPLYDIGRPEDVQTALGNRGRKILDVLVRSLDDRDPVTQQAAASAILRVEAGRPSDRALLLRAWRAAGHDDVPTLLAFAAEFSRVASGTPDEQAAWHLALTAPEDPDIPWGMAIGLQSETPAGEASRRSLTLRLIHKFLNEMGEPDPAVRRKAILALNQLVRSLDERHVARLLAALQDSDPEVRRLTIQALWKWGIETSRADVPITGIPPAPGIKGPLWPPPLGYVRGELLLDALSNRSPNWGDVAGWLVTALSAAEYTVSYYPIPGRHGSVHRSASGNSETAPLDGFALLTRIEQVDAVGLRLKQGEDRAELGLLWPRSFGEVWARLTGKPAGRYRMILFVLRPGPELPEFIGGPRATGIADEEAVMSFWWLPTDLRSISKALPEPMRGKPFGHGRVWVVIYDIERRQGGALKPYFSGEIDLGKNLRAAGLGSLFGDGAQPR
jgi:hypothetical protein